VTQIWNVLLETVGLIGKGTHHMWGTIYMFLWNCWFSRKFDEAVSTALSVVLGEVVLE